LVLLFWRRQDVAHVVPLHPNGQVMAVAGTQAPAELQVDGPRALPAVHVAAPQVVLDMG
jgi:hypothetical protein